MGLLDSAMKIFLTNNEVFSEVYNHDSPGEGKLIDPKDLRDVNTNEVLLLPKGTKGFESLQRDRDLVKVLSMKETPAEYLVILGIEVQKYGDKTMPIRIGLMDFIAYNLQVTAAKARHREEHNYEGRTKGEVLSNFFNEDEIKPVATRVLYLGPGAWPGPHSLHEILTVKDPRILAYVPDYKLNIIEPALMSEEELQGLQTELRVIYSIAKLQEDKEKLWEYLNREKMCQSMSYSGAAAAFALAGVTFEQQDTKGGEINMCKAMRELLEDSKREGIIIGQAEKQQAHQEGVDEGASYMSRLTGYMLDEGRIEELKKCLIDLKLRKQYMLHYGIIQA